MLIFHRTLPAIFKTQPPNRHRAVSISVATAHPAECFPAVRSRLSSAQAVSEWEAPVVREHPERFRWGQLVLMGSHAATFPSEETDPTHSSKRPTEISHFASASLSRCGFIL